MEEALEALAEVERGSRVPPPVGDPCRGAEHGREHVGIAEHVRARERQA
jgi:hypothetical protein